MLSNTLDCCLTFIKNYKMMRDAYQIRDETYTNL